jgi:hypothetical protein
VPAAPLLSDTGFLLSCSRPNGQPASGDAGPPADAHHQDGREVQRGHEGTERSPGGASPFPETRSVWSRACVNSVEGRRQHVERPPVIVPSPPFRRTRSTPRERRTSLLPPGSLSTTTATSPTTSSGWSSRAPRRRRPRTPLLPPPCLPGRSRRTELPGQASPGAYTLPDERRRSPAQVITSSTSQSGGSFDPPRRPTVLLAPCQGAQMSVDRGWLGRGRSSGAHQGQSSRCGRPVSSHAPRSHLAVLP